MTTPVYRVRGYETVVPFRQKGHRTEEQIQADLEARYAEMEAEAERRKADPLLNFPCETCRFFEKNLIAGLITSERCHCPLVKGFGPPYRLAALGHQREPIPPLCGPEKALWRPRLTLWQRILAWIDTITTEGAGE